MEKSSTILVTGASGLVGRSVARHLLAMHYTNVLTPRRLELDLTSWARVDEFFARHHPTHVLAIAAKVGGIAANIADPVGFLDQNLQMQCNLLRACNAYGTTKNAFLGSSCMFPRESAQPMKEEYLLTGPLETTNESYALAKIAGVRLAQAYHKQYGLNTICLVPCNVYGIDDHFNLQSSHVLSALVKRFVDAVDAHAPTVTLWGSGSARREFMHVDDLAAALLFLMDRYDAPEIVNVGTGQDCTIRALAETIAELSGFGGEIRWDRSKPDGMPRKVLDVSRLIALGFRTRIRLDDGLREVIAHYRLLKGCEST